MLLSLFAMPISFNPLGLRLQLCLTLAHFAGVLYLWRIASRRGNPKRLLDTALVTMVFIFLVPLCMLVAPAIILAAYALPSPAWKAVAMLMLLAGGLLGLIRIWSIATDKDTGRRFEIFLADELKENVITTHSINTLLTHVGRHAIGPTRIDGWSMAAAIIFGAPILLANISYDKSSSSLAFCALITTPMAAHTISRLVVHTYLWIFRLARFEREVGIKIVVNIRQ
ncbi:hypothetical protein ABT364_21160 [Massilia sp. SR12]